MDSLKTDGYALAVLTNGHADVQRPKLEACGAAELFGGSINGRGEFSRRGKGGNSSKEGRVERRLIVAGDFPAMKPDPAVFLAAASACGVHISEAIMVGDSLRCDIRGGNTAGCLATVWVQSCPTLDEGPDESADQPHARTLGGSATCEVAGVAATSFWDPPAATLGSISVGEEPTFSVQSVLDLRSVLEKLG